MDIGMNEEEVAALKENLSKDYGGLVKKSEKSINE